jgi:hypothetical protein
LKGDAIMRVADVYDKNLVFENEHNFMDLDEGRFLLDTGSPFSCSIKGAITLAGIRKTYSRTILGMDISHIRRLTGPECMGLIGMDFLAAQDTFWNGLKRAIVFGQLSDMASSDGIEADFRLGLRFRAIVAGRSTPVIFDTGAKYGYLLNVNQANGCKSAGRIDDYNPILDEMNSESWIVPVEIAGVHLEERMGLLPEAAARMMRIMGVGAVLGCSWIPDRLVWLKPSVRRCVIE